VSGIPYSASTATAAATALAALLPRPLASGRFLCRVMFTPWRAPSSLNTLLAATAAEFLAGSRGSLPPSPSMAAITAPGSSRGSTMTVSPGSSKANPRMSNPQPTFPMLAGAKASALALIMIGVILVCRSFTQPNQPESRRFRSRGVPWQASYSVWRALDNTL